MDRTSPQMYEEFLCFSSKPKGISSSHRKSTGGFRLPSHVAKPPLAAWEALILRPLCCYCFSHHPEERHHHLCGDESKSSGSPGEPGFLTSRPIMCLEIFKHEASHSKEVLRFSHTRGVSMLLNRAAPLPLSLPRGDSFPRSTTSNPLCSPASSDGADTSESQRTCVCHDCSLPVLRLDCHPLRPTPPPSPAHQTFPVNGMNRCPNSASHFEPSLWVPCFWNLLFPFPHHFTKNGLCTKWNVKWKEWSGKFKAQMPLKFTCPDLNGCVETMWAGHPSSGPAVQALPCRDWLMVTWALSIRHSASFMRAILGPHTACPQWKDKTSKELCSQTADLWHDVK